MSRLCVLFLAATAILGAQEYRGTISGNVIDPAGAAVPKAKITATEIHTGAKTRVESETSGAYTIPFLAPGEYDLSAEASGFKTYNRHGLVLDAGASPTVDIRLDVGAVTESVTVVGETPVLEAANPTVGQVLNTKEVDEVPVNGRVPMMLGNLAFGVISTYEPGPVRPFDNSAPNEISIGGAPSSRNEVLLDGAPNAGQTNQMAYSPIMDATTEVRVNTFDMDAGQGHTMGGSVNVITKSGSNDFHAATWIYNQTSVVDANSFYNNSTDKPRPPYHQNQYGVMGSGPVLVPKVFNGRNKVFWLFAYEGMRDSDPANSPLETGSPENLTTVPTDAERQGNFSALLPLGSAYTIYDPTTSAASATTPSRTPFPNNTIPASRISPIAQALLKYYPEPDAPGLANGTQNFSTADAIDSDGYDNEMGKLDFNLSDKNRLTFNARHNYRAQNKNNFFDNPATGNYLFRINQGAGLDDVYTFSPTLFSDIRVSWTRYIENHSSPADGIDPASFGFPSYIDSNSKFLMLPYITFNTSVSSGGALGVSAGARNEFEPLGYNGDSTNYNDIFQLFGDLVKIHGNHTIKMGVDAREYRWSGYTFGNPSGTYGFDSVWTNAAGSSGTAAPLGQEFASFLLGLPASGSIDENTQSTVHSKYLGLFINDDWKVKPNFTLNLGLRWEHDFPEYEKYDRSLNGFNPTAVNPISAAAAAAYAASPTSLLPASQFHALGGPTFEGQNGMSSIYNVNSHIFSPRLGFAWTPQPKTVIRGGLGVLVDPILLPIGGSAPAVGGSNAAYGTLNQPGFSQNTPMVVNGTNYVTPTVTLANPFPNGILSPTGSALGLATNLGSSITVMDPNIRDPYVVRWELSVQRELGKGYVLEVAYIGNRANHLPIETQLDYIPAQYLSTSLVRNQTVINQLTATTTNPFYGLPNFVGLTGKTVAVDQLLIPFPQYTVPTPPSSPTSGGVDLQENPAGSSYYHSLNVRVQKQFSHNFLLLNNFVWSRMTDRLAYLNDSDPAPEKRISSDSRPLRDVLLATYALPIGRNRALNLQNRVLDGIVGGWGLGGTLTLQSGPVLGWGNYIYFGAPLNYNAHQPNGLAFNTSAFDTASADQLADNIRTFDNQFNNLRRDATEQLDVNMTKNFKVNERGAHFQLRIEAFNATNRVTFSAPNTTPTSSAFGTIAAQANTPRRIQTALKFVW